MMSIRNIAPQGTGENDPLWGACSCFEYVVCSPCQHAEELETEGLDWEEEYQKSLRAKDDNEN